MPLDTSAYNLAQLRIDGRRWNELRRLHAQISTQAAADGSSYLEMGNTKVICTVLGPQEQRKGGSGNRDQSNEAKIEVEIGFAGFSGTDRKKRARGDKRTAEMQYSISNAFSATLLTHLYPHSTIDVRLHILSQDGSVLAACINATTLALIDAGIPMTDYISACTVATTAAFADREEEADPLLDVNSLEELDCPFLTISSVGGNVGTLIMETRVQTARLEGMIAVGLDGCLQVKKILDNTIRDHGKRLLDNRIS